MHVREGFSRLSKAHHRQWLRSSRTDKNLLLRAARTQRCAGEGELVFGLTKHVASLARAGCGFNTFCSLCSREFSPTLGVWPAGFGGAACGGAGIEPGPPGARAHPAPSRLDDAAFFSRSGRFRSQGSGPRRHRVRRCRDPAPLTGAVWAAGHARRRGAGELSQPPARHQ